MPDISELIRHEITDLWLFVPTATMLGVLHGLEPGHSKTMMAAFIVAVRGTIGQAILLGLSAALSHSLLVWLIALAGLHYGGQFYNGTNEPYFQLASAVLIVGVASWMMFRLHNDHHAHKAAVAHTHASEHIQHVNTGHETSIVEIYEHSAPARFRLRFEQHGHPVTAYNAKDVSLITVRSDGASDTFTFSAEDGFLESQQIVADPHEFKVVLHLRHGNHTHDFKFEFADQVDTHNDAVMGVSDDSFQDEHAKAHAEDIRRRFTNRHVSTGQIILFGLTGGLIPCPAALTVLLLCLQLNKFSLGFALVACFSIGLAGTMVLSGVVAAWGVRHATKRWAGFEAILRGAPYISSTLILLIGLFMGIRASIALL